MHCLFEPGDIMNSPYEAFIFDTDIFSFPVRQHWHYYMEVLYIIEGTTMVSCGDKEYTLLPGDMVAFYPKNLHSIYAPQGSKERLMYYVLKFDLNRFRENIGSIPQLKSVILQSETDEKAFIHFTASQLKDYPVVSLFETCAKEYHGRNFGFYLAIHSSISQILLTMIRVWRGNGFIPSSNAHRPADNSVESITEYIDAHSHQALHVEDLATICNMSYSFFAKRFKQIYGRSCKEYIEFIRITKAEDMLLFTDYDLTYISQETGFSDCSHMIKTFKKYKNITPKQFRLQNTSSKG